MIHLVLAKLPTKIATISNAFAPLRMICVAVFVGSFANTKWIIYGVRQSGSRSWWKHTKSFLNLNTASKQLNFYDLQISIEDSIDWAEAYLHAKYDLDPSSHLATINIGRKFVWGVRPLADFLYQIALCTTRA